jgi:copper chaperone CopZ
MNINRSIQGLICALLVLAACCGCYRNDIRTIQVDVPQLKNAECIKIIQDALAQVEGIQTAQASLENHTFSITYDSRKLAIKNIEYVITHVGFDANGNPAEKSAREKLPAACQ